MTTPISVWGERSVRSSARLLLSLITILTISFATPQALVAREDSPVANQGLFDPELPQRGPLTRSDDLRRPSDLTVWGIDQMLAARTTLPPLGADFLGAERLQQVNARFLLSVAMAESGWGRSWLAHHKQNLFGFGARDHNPRQHAADFASYAEGVATVAAFLKRHYLNPGGRYYHGPTLDGVARSYAPAGSWAGLISSVSRALRITDPIRDYHWSMPLLSLQPAPGSGYQLTVRAAATPENPKAPSLSGLGGRLLLIEAHGATPLTLDARAVATDGQMVNWSFLIPAGLLGDFTLRFEPRDSDSGPLPSTPPEWPQAIARLEILAPEATVGVGADLLLAVRNADGRILVLRRTDEPVPLAPDLSRRSTSPQRARIDFAALPTPRLPLQNAVL